MIGLIFLGLLGLLAAFDAGAPTHAGSAADVEAYRAFVDAWVDSQNGGRFDEYAALYAEDFHGVRRSGERVVEFDRQGWLHDRERMFKKPMQVKVDSLRVLSVLAGDVELGFNQEFSQGSYRDQGAKLLRLRHVNGRQLIRGEEMLSSAIVPPGLPPLNLPLVLDGCPGEYCNCVTSDRLRNAVQLRERPDRDSKIILRLPVKTKVQNVVFKVLIYRPGIARRETGGRVYYLGYAAEGMCMIHTGKQIEQASCDGELRIEDGSVAGEVWVAITFKGQTGYTLDDSAVAHGYMSGGGKCVFGE